MMKNTPYGKRVETLRRLLADTPCDTVWIVQPENRRYLSGFKAEDAQPNESSGSLLINREKALLVTDSRYTTEARQEAAGFEIHTLQKDTATELPALLQQIGVRKLGFEENYLTWGLHNHLSRRAAALESPLELMPLLNIVEKMREVKEDREVAELEASAAMISGILDEVIAELRPGRTERETAWRIGDIAHAKGADGLAFPPIVASGPNSALPHAVPTDRKLGKGEPIIFDVGVRLNGYCSDITRTVFLGNPQNDFKKIYSVVRQAQLAALAEVRSGVSSDHPDAVARKVIKEAGFADYFGHSLGHGVGLATHEGPRLRPSKPVELKRGMVVTVEPGIYIPGKGGVRLEEMVLVAGPAARVLTKNGHFYDFGPSAVV